MLAIQPVESDEIIIEYYEPSEVTKAGKLIITRVGHDYKGIINILNSEDGRYGQSAWCNVDINCTAGDNWQTEKWSVCRILIQNTWLCSGSLINNTSNDYKALFLTANHCISTTAKANNSVFVFNYESPSCDGPDGSVSQSISGSTLRAHWSTSDFSLVELSSAPPISYYPVWNGWDRWSSTPSAPVTCIHHPAGDVRKISIDSDPVYIEGNFWCVDNWDTGTTQGGSSGSPLYNSDKRVVGQDSYSDCSGCDLCGSDKGSCYGKISSSWNGGGTSASRLRNWLDPTSKGTVKLDIIRRQYISGPFLVCTSNSTFTLHNRPSGTTVSWTPSSNLSYVSGQGTNSYTVKAASSSTFGWGWVEATIDGDRGDVIFREDFWVGKFESTVVTGQAAVCPDELYTYTAQVPGGHSSSYNYDWTYPGNWIWQAEMENWIRLKTPKYNPQYGTVQVEITNVCGTAGPSGITVYPGYCGGGGGYYSMSPNPADDYVEISIDESKLVENKIDDYEVRIYNGMNIMVSQIRTRKPTLRINTRQFVNGIYTVHFIIGDKLQVEQLVISH